MLYLRIIHGSKIPNNSVPSRARTRTRFVRCLFFPTLHYFDFFIVQETLTTLGIYIYFAFQSAQSSAGMKTYRRSGKFRAVDLYARNSLSQVSRGFSNVSRLKRPSTWPRAILDRVCTITLSLRSALFANFWPAITGM